MAKVELPKKKSRKGAPPKPSEAPSNLTRPDTSGEMFNLTFTVPKEFRDEFKIYSLHQGKPMVEVFYEAYQLHKRANPQNQ